MRIVPIKQNFCAEKKRILRHVKIIPDYTSLFPGNIDIAAHTPDNKTPLNHIDLNDIYCHFPEMSTHHLKEVEDFTFMCSQLFQLEEAIKSQKQILNSLELDLQRELQPGQLLAEGGPEPQPTCETPLPG